MNLNDLKGKYNSCNTCTNCLTDTKVYGHGNADAKICVVGEGPGRYECEQGKPFVGPAGQLLDKILIAIGIKREDVYFTNTVICRTDYKNRTPTTKEMLNCRPRLLEELSIIKPNVTLLVGSPALKTIFGKDCKITSLHGTWMTLLSSPCYFYFPIYHPAWILHSATENEMKGKKRLIWKDIRIFKDGLESFERTKLFQK